MDEQIFKKGDRVWCCIYGWGTVSAISNLETSNPVEVEFDLGSNSEYTKDGRLKLTVSRTLFFKEQKFDDSRPEPVYEEGAWYWADIVGDKLPIRYLGEYHWSVNGVINKLDPKVICKIEEPK